MSQPIARCHSADSANRPSRVPQYKSAIRVPIYSTQTPENTQEKTYLSFNTAKMTCVCQLANFNCSVQLSSLQIAVSPLRGTNWKFNYRIKLYSCSKMRSRRAVQSSIVIDWSEVTNQTSICLCLSSSLITSSPSASTSISSFFPQPIIVNQTTLMMSLILTSSNSLIFAAKYRLAHS